MAPIQGNDHLCTDLGEDLPFVRPHDHCLHSHGCPVTMTTCGCLFQHVHVSI